MTDTAGQRGQPNLIDVSGQDLASVRPGRLLLRTAGVCDLDPQHLLEVFGEQRRRFVAVLQGFGPGDWAAPTRCADWSVHAVVRHLCDGNAIGIAAGTDDGTLDVAAGFDPRVTPRGWLTALAGESPGATLGRLMATTEQLLVLAHDRLAQGRRAAPGAGTHLVHEHRRDPGDDGQDQPTLTACISGKSQP
jgi:Mycothiol maleylpyruvate isomerase N-terminal domain